jgi:hypothetical protein
MRIWFLTFAVVLLTACSDTPTVEKKAKAPEPPSEPITGRQAFQQTFPPARGWAADCEPLRVRSFNLDNPKSHDGKAGAWEIVWVSQARARARTYTWSAIEAEGNLHKGVFAGREEPWSPQGMDRPFLPAAIKIDTTDALQTAIGRSAEYMKNGKPKPQVNFMLESTSRFPDPAWRIFWGESVSAAEWSVFIDASTGVFVGR